MKLTVMSLFCGNGAEFLLSEATPWYALKFLFAYILQMSKRNWIFCLL